MSSSTARPSTPKIREVDNISCRVGSSVLPSIMTDRPADRIRLAGVGIHGRTLTPTLTTVPCTRRVHMRGWFAPRRRSATPGRLLVMGCSLQNSVTRSNGHSIRAVRLDVFRVLPADTGQAVGAASPACPTANSTW
ncbi:Uncharacterised protein [Mycobacterium tuberculosis]|uniref:Uncharacterized protein n=1 Tax=Mycobacterium tuberculosis TaxID=1773 RepID=A0A655ING4_MYCTX|nr:Uncharacterised protein [Mycobacterium tuberculosis]SGO53278.1 Uncharacterised protein [Mycobacterium tuberculosis]